MCRQINLTNNAPLFFWQKGEEDEDPDETGLDLAKKKRFVGRNVLYRLDGV